MKAFTQFLLIVFIIAASVLMWQRYRPDPLLKKPEQTNSPSVSAPNDIPPSEYIEIKDQKGRSLICKVTAKKASFIEIEREADRQRFVINLSSVDAPSRLLVSSNDFNAANLDPEIFKLAKARLKTELLIAPELNYFRCPKSGQMMKSAKGLEVDSYKDDLKKMGLTYKELPFQLKRVADGGMFYPDGIRELPCLRIGNTVVYGRNPTEIRKVVIDEYIRLVALTEM